MSFTLADIIGALGGGLGLFLLKFYNDWLRAKRGDAKDLVGAWQEIVDRGSDQIKQLEERLAQIEERYRQINQDIAELMVYIGVLEKIIIDAGMELPKRQK